MVEGLDRRLASRGGTPDEWLRLVRAYSVLGERDQAIKALDRARMALAANSEAVTRLDGLARELDLPAKSNP
jgi:cytochrome c-type biogenesis protein CcmH